MTHTLLTDIPFQPDPARVYKQLRLEPGTPLAKELDQHMDEAVAIGRPKTIYHVGLIDERDDEGVVIDGIRFTSHVLAVNLAGCRRVLAYVATCGRELDDWAHGLDDVLHAYWAEAIKEQALRAAISALHEDIERRLAPGKMSNMNPGSLPNWPLKEQRPLFALMGVDVEEAVGVRLEQNLLMNPNKSVSGLRFETETDFSNCQLCPRRDCPGRRAPYDPQLLKTRYQQ